MTWGWSRVSTWSPSTGCLMTSTPASTAWVATRPRNFVGRPETEHAACPGQSTHRHSLVRQRHRRWINRSQLVGRCGEFSARLEVVEQSDDDLGGNRVRFGASFPSDVDPHGSTLQVDQRPSALLGLQHRVVSKRVGKAASAKTQLTAQLV